MEREYIALEDQIRPRYASIVWTHKIQEKQAEINEKKYAVLATINIVSASLTSAGIITTIFSDQTWVKILSASVSFITVFITALLKTFDFQSMAKANKTTATELVILRDEMQFLLYKVRHATHPVADLLDEFTGIQTRVHAVYQEAPQTTDKAVAKANIALKEKKDDSYTDEEIDVFLPEGLRRGTPME